MESAKNKQATKNRQEKIKKVAALKAQDRGSWAQPSHTSKKRKHAFNVQSSSKGVSGSSIHPKAYEVVIDALRHGKGKGLMTSQCLVFPSPRDQPFGWLRSSWHDENMFPFHSSPCVDLSLYVVRPSLTLTRPFLLRAWEGYDLCKFVAHLAKCQSSA